MEEDNKNADVNVNNNNVVNNNNMNNDVNNTKKKSKVGLIIGIIAGVMVFIMIVVGIIGYMLYRRYNEQQLEILKDEISKITESKITKNTDIDMEIKSKGNYGIVEKTIKEYLNKVVELSNKEVSEIVDTNELKELISVDNIQKDGPDFISTSEKIDKMRTNAEEYYNEIIDLCTESNILDAIQNKGLSDYYINLYKELMLDNEASKSLEEGKEQLEDSKDTVIKTFNWVTQVFDYLSENKDYWSVSNGRIVFTDSNKLTEYNKIIFNRPQ